MKLPSLKKILKKTAPLIKTMLGNLRTATEVVIVCVILFYGWKYNRKLDEIDSLRADMGKLADNLKEQVTIMDNQVEIVKRIGGKVTIQKIYMPAEGGTVISVSSSTGKVVYKYNTKGFTLNPGGGGIWSGNGAQIYLDVKWAYWNRYSAVAGGSPQGAGIGISRHIDDILPGKLHNVELFMNYIPIRRTTINPVGFGIRSNF